ncbi:MAG: hypothetical protein R3321_07715 [Nitrososphaeraceae archaeon]|nr:hypothetical protein [Nitrososphaeraceae archaeon]
MFEGKRYKLVSTFKQTLDYVDPQRKEKGILTDFINETFLKFNYNEVELLQLIYETIQPILDEYGLVLVFKGGNVMRLINNNFKQYLQPIPNDIIYGEFEPYLKQSDNDFTIFIDPNLPDYNDIIFDVTDRLYYVLEALKIKLMKNSAKYFNIFRLSDKIFNKIFDVLSKELGGKEVELSPVYNKFITNKDPLNPKTDVTVYDDLKFKPSIIFNTINFSLQFKDPHNKTIRFFLLRSKINFKVGKKNLSGELIDISIPHRDDASISKLDSTAKFRKFLHKNIIRSYNKEYKFTYYLISIDYIIDDLYKILYSLSEYPWKDEKYQKRIARLLYFIFIEYVNSHKISEATFRTIRTQFERFFDQIYNLNIKTVNTNKHLQNIYNSTLDLIVKIKDKEDQSNNFVEYTKLIVDYSEYIVRICNALIAYITGKTCTNLEKIYELDIV